MNRINHLFVCAVVAHALFAVTQNALADTATVYVDGDLQTAIPTGQPGWGEDHAYKYLQDALDHAADLLGLPEWDDVELWVAATDAANPYRPDRDAANPTGSGDREESFTLLNNVEIYGGFLGTDHPTEPETELSQRDPYTNVTVLSGDLDGDDVGFQNNEENSYHVVYALDTDNTSRLDGFTVQGGNGGASLSGGGILLERSGAAIIRCTISGNTARFGAGIHTRNPPGGDPERTDGPIFLNCAVKGNQAIWYGGGLFNSDSIAITLVNTLFNENYANYGTGGAIMNGVPLGALELTNCTIVGNHAPVAIGGGGGLYTRNTLMSVSLTNSVFWGNTAYNGSIDKQQIDVDTYPYPPTPLDMNYCCIQGWEPGNPLYDQYSASTTGMTGDDPLFVDPDGPDNDPETWQDNNFRLDAGSSCIHAGQNSALPYDAFDLDYDGVTLGEYIPMDLAGVTRIMGFRHDLRVDIGAYEYLICEGDANADGIVDVLDLLVVLGDWGPCPGCAGDVNGDDVVDVLDLLLVLADWGCGNPILPDEPPQSVQDCIDKYGDDIEKMIGCIEAILLTEG